ncbi:MAG: hypothetical protein ACOX6X_03450 [Dethiobacteria bacterium]|jgi:hypothetical protein
MCCHDHRHQNRHHGPASQCCCGGGGGLQRRFFTKEEEIARLEDYLNNLQAEIKAVEARIQALKED